MERYIRVCLLGIFMMFGFINTASAESVRSPLNSYVVTSATCDFMGECDMTGLHMAEDVRASAGTAVYAPTSGVIKDNTVHTRYGTVVLLEASIDGETVVFLMGHMRQVDLQVSIGQSVTEGQLLGYIGTNMGNRDSLYDNGGWPDHLHFGVHKGAYANGTSCTGAWTYAGYETAACAYDDWYDPTDFIASHQLDCSTYTSEFSSTKSAFGSFIGSKDGSPYLYDGICAQDYDDSGTSDGDSAILYDASGEANQAYLVRSGFWTHYDNVCGGPEGDCSDSAEVNQCGPPIGDEYYNGTNIETGYGTARQDFQTCYLYWNGSVASSEFYPEVAPGWFDGASVWQGTISYAFAEAYETNGSRNDMGEAVEQFGNPAGVHHWGNDSSLPYVQDFNGATYGWSILMYNEDLEQAFLITGDIWDRYNNYGPDIYGPPCDDLQDTSTGAIQYFEHAIIRWKSSNGSTSVRENSEGCSSYSVSAISATESDWDYTSLDLSAQAAVDYADPTASPACLVDASTGDLHVVFSTESGRIQELTYNGSSWTSLDLSAQAAVAYASLGTSPRIFSHPDTGERFVIFTGDNRRLYLLRSNSGTWSSIDLSSQAAVDWADLDSEPFGFIHPQTTNLHVVFSTESGRIQELTYNGNVWTSLDLSAQAPVPYASLGTSPVSFPNPQSTERFVVFNGNGRIQLLRSNTGTWSSLDVSAQAAVDYADLDSSPFGYLTSDASLLAILLNTQGDRIQQLTYDGNYWTSLDLSSQTAVSYSDPGTSPVEMIDTDVPNRAIVFMGEGGRLQQFVTDGSTWDSADLSSEAPVDFAASGTSPGVCLDPVTQTRYVVFTTTGKRIQLIQYGP